METWQWQLLAWVACGLLALPFAGTWRDGDGFTRAVTFGGALLLGPYLLVPLLAMAAYRVWRNRS